MADRTSTWNWAYLIPITALLIPIVAILSGTEVIDTLADGLAWALAIAATIGAATLGGRYLVTLRHDLRMRELEAEREVARLELDRLDHANRLLEQDDRIHELRSELQTPPPPESPPDGEGQMRSQDA